jgi:hypothetical protein
MKKLKPQRVDFEQIGRFLASAEKKLVAAQKTLATAEKYLSTIRDEIQRKNPQAKLV